MKRLSLELGGNAPMIVFKDADIDAAVEGISKCKFRNSGQACVSANRIFVHKSLVDQIIPKLSAGLAQLKIGNGPNSEVQIGPLIDERSIKHSHELIADGLEKGGKLICGGKVHAELGGLFYEPTLLCNLNKQYR